MRISPFAASYVRKRTTEHMVDACKIWTPGEVQVDEDGSAYRAQGELKYEGPCRYWEVSAGQHDRTAQHISAARAPLDVDELDRR